MKYIKTFEANKIDTLNIKLLFYSRKHASLNKM
jgi:hypothetical protein